MDTGNQSWRFIVNTTQVEEQVKRPFVRYVRSKLLRDGSIKTSLVNLSWETNADCRYWLQYSQQPSPELGWEAYYAKISILSTKLLYWFRRKNRSFRNNKSILNEECWIVHKIFSITLHTNIWRKSEWVEGRPEKIMVRWRWWDPQEMRNLEGGKKQHMTWYLGHGGRKDRKIWIYLIISV